jgi:hypothetical protein
MLGLRNAIARKGVAAVAAAATATKTTINTITAAAAATTTLWIVCPSAAPCPACPLACPTLSPCPACPREWIGPFAVACGVGFAGLLAFVTSLLWIRYVIHEDFLWGAAFRRAGL